MDTLVNDTTVAAATTQDSAKSSSAERIAREITKGVLKRRYLIGQRLIESELTSYLSVSRSTVREALKILAAQGLVEIIPNRGAIVRSLSYQDAANLLAVLEVLTGLAARLAAERIEQGNNRAIFIAASTPLIQPSPVGELDKIVSERARFYQAMLDIAANEELERALPLTRAHLLRAQFYNFLSKSDLKAMVGEYRKISTAILAGDGKRAELFAREHMRMSGERTLRFLR